MFCIIILYFIIISYQGELTDHHHISTPSSPTTRQRNPGSQLDRCLCRDLPTLWRRLKTSASIVLDVEDIMNRNSISSRNNLVVKL